MANLIKLYTRHGAIWVDSNQLSRQDKTHLSIFTSHGNQLSVVGKTESIRLRASFGVHRSNLFATPELAKSDSDRIYADMARRGNMESVQVI